MPKKKKNWTSKKDKFFQLMQYQMEKSREILLVSMIQINTIMNQ